MKLSRLFVQDTKQKTPPILAVFNLLLVVCAIVAVFWFALSRIGVQFNFSFLANFSKRIRMGFGTTVAISLASMVVSLAIGILGALGQGSKLLPIRYFSTLYVQFIRGTPLMMQIYLFFYIIGTAFGVENRFIAGVLTLSMFEGAYISEIIRGSLLSLDESQLEAAKAVGFTNKQTIAHVILPQLVARTLPALTGQFASIIKDSSLLSMIAVSELAQTMREISSTNFKLFECFIFLGVLYLALTIPVSLASKWLEKRFDYDR